MIETTDNNPQELIEGLIAAIAEQDYVETVKLQKNASVEGKTSSHPIDLYWEFTSGGLTYKTLISTETLNTVVVRADVVKLVDKLRDIYGQATGVLFSRPVYDDSIVIMADKANINICEMMPLLPDVWEPAVENFKINADTEFIQKEKERLGITELVSVNSKDPRQLFLYNENFDCTDTIDSIISGYIDENDPENFKKCEINHIFERPIYLQTDNAEMPFVKLLSISFTLEFKLVRQMSGDDKSEEAHLLIENILYNISRYVISE
jgi:hypothetical protein